MSARVLCVVFCVLTSQRAAAELIVIHDSGRTRPLAEFVASAQQMPPSATPRDSGPALLSVAVQDLLPIRSPGLAPGPVASRPYPQVVQQAFFLIGADARSRQWLAAHRDDLIGAGAVGLLVQADSVQDLQTIAAIANGLAITPASGTDIARALGVSHYPFAISGGRLWQ